jgi:hypothetical protein
MTANADSQFHGKICMSGTAHVLYMHINQNVSAFIENRLFMKARAQNSQQSRV